MGGIGAAVLGSLADLYGIEFVYRHVRVLAAARDCRRVLAGYRTSARLG